MRALWLLVLLTMAAGMGCGGSDGGGDETSAIPPGAVAVVGGQPVPKADLDVSVAALDRGRRNAADPDDGDDLREEALTTLLERIWIERETDKLGIRIDRAEVQRTIEVARRAFATPSARRRFLGGLTERDLRDQLRDQVLYEQLADHVAGVPGTQQLALWLSELWSPRTTCLRAYARVPGCEDDRP